MDSHDLPVHIRFVLGAGTEARVIIHKHFSVFGLPNQIHLDNGGEFVNQL